VWPLISNILNKKNISNAVGYNSNSSFLWRHICFRRQIMGYRSTEISSLLNNIKKVQADAVVYVPACCNSAMHGDEYAQISQSLEESQYNTLNRGQCGLQIWCGYS
jgi:hypothetical protein